MIRVIGFLGLSWLYSTTYAETGDVAKADSALSREQYVDALQILLAMEASAHRLSFKIRADMAARLATCYDYFEYEELAILNYEKAAALYRQCGDSLNLAYTLAYLADLREDMGQIDQAIADLKRAERIFLVQNDPKGMILFCNNLSSVYENFGQFDTCQSLLNRALSLCALAKDSLLWCITLNNLGDVKRKQKDHQAALILYQQALELAKSIGSREEERGSLKDLSISYAALGQYEQAYRLHREFYELHQQLKIEHKIEQIVQIHLENIRTKAELEKKALRFKLVAIAIGLGAVLLVVVVVFLAYRYKTRKDKQLSIARQNVLQLELEAARLREQNAQSDLRTKEETLREYSKMLAKNSETLAALQNKLKEALEHKKETRYQEISRLTRASILTPEDWNNFKERFEQVYTGFFAMLREKYSDLSQGDLRLLALLKLNMSKEEIAAMTGVSPDSVKKAKTRLKKRLGLSEHEKIEPWLATIG